MWSCWVANRVEGKHGGEVLLLTLFCKIVEGMGLMIWKISRLGPLDIFFTNKLLQMRSFLIETFAIRFF